MRNHQKIGTHDLQGAISAVIGPFALFIVTALGVALVNYQVGSLRTTPGTSFIFEGVVLASLFVAASLLRIQKRAKAMSLDDLAVKKLRLIAIAFSVMLTPLSTLLLAPGINGMVGLSDVFTERMVLEDVKQAGRTKRGRVTHYNAHLVAKSGGALPAGRYMLGRFGQAWLPNDGMPRYGSEVLVTWRTGLLGKRTVLSAVPVESR